MNITMKRCYIAGPVSGRSEPEYREHFALAEVMVRQIGYESVSPVTLPHDHDRTWESFMREDLTALLSCELIYLLNGWQNSRGATIELGGYAQLGMTILHELDYRPLETCPL